jgi:hypothetical protein
MEAFHTLAEVSVAIAGFSSLAIVFRGQNSDWQGQDYVSLAFAMSWSIGGVFFSLFPIVLGELGIDLVDSTRIGLFGMAAYMLIVGGFLTYVRRKVEGTGGGVAQLSLGLSLLFGLIVIGAVAAGLGLFPGPSHGWFAAAITLLIAHATAELGLLVISVVRHGE